MVTDDAAASSLEDAGTCLIFGSEADLRRLFQRIYGGDTELERVCVTEATAPSVVAETRRYLPCYACRRVFFFWAVRRMHGQPH